MTTCRDCKHSAETGVEYLDCTPPGSEDAHRVHPYAAVNCNDYEEREPCNSGR